MIAPYTELDATNDIEYVACYSLPRFPRKKLTLWPCPDFVSCTCVPPTERDYRRMIGFELIARGFPIGWELVEEGFFSHDPRRVVEEQMRMFD